MNPAYSFMGSLPPEPVLDCQTKQETADVKGERRYSMQLVCCSRRKALRWSW
jgi:hypothetical protein